MLNILKASSVTKLIHEATQGYNEYNQSIEKYQGLRMLLLLGILQARLRLDAKAHLMISALIQSFLFTICLIEGLQVLFYGTSV